MMSGEWTIRRARNGDTRAISKLMEELGYPLAPDEVEKRLRIYTGLSEFVLVAEGESGIAGFVSFHAIPLFHAPEGLGRITAMCVAGNRRRAGIGRALLERLESMAEALGCTRIEVTSGDHRAEVAHRFYQSCGYVSNSRRFQKVLSQSREIA